MAKQDDNRAQERAQQLNDLKRDVNLIDLATQRYGYRITEGRGGESNVKLENGLETLNVNRGKDGWLVYQNKNNDQDRGSVVDFVQERHPEKNFGQVRAQLMEYAPGSSAALTPRIEQTLPSASEANQRYEQLPASERRAAMLDDATGGRGRPGQPGLVVNDSSYLLERGLSKDTITDPAFKGRVFTDQHPDRQFDNSGNPRNNLAFPMYNTEGLQSYEVRNRPPAPGEPSIKFQMRSPGERDEAGNKVDGRNGVWSSNLLEKGEPVARMVIGESPIDLMSKYQLEKEQAQATGEPMPNSRFIGTGGNPSLTQLAIIQQIIDREKPAAIVLANDNDIAGQAFNARMIGALRGPQESSLSPELQQQAQASRERVSWIANDEGRGEDKQLKLVVTVRHEQDPSQGQAFTEQLREKTAALGMNGQEPAERGQDGLHQRSSNEQQTVLELRVHGGQRAQVVELAQQLRQDREADLPEQARTPAAYFVVETAQGKDYNQDILQAREAEQLAARRIDAGFDLQPTQQVEPQIAADINLNGSTSRDEIIEADRNRDGQVTDTELRAARFERDEQQQPDRGNPTGVAVDLNGDGISSSAERQAADTNGDGIVTQAEADSARARVAEAEAVREETERQKATQLAEIEFADRMKAQQVEQERREQQAQANEQGQSTGPGLAEFVLAQAVAQGLSNEPAQQRDPAPVSPGQPGAGEAEPGEPAGVARRLTATVDIAEPAGPWPGTLPPENNSLELYGERVKRALETAGAEVYRQTHYPPVSDTRHSELTVIVDKGSEQEKEVAAILRAAQVQGGGVAVQGIELPEQAPAPRPELDRGQGLDQLAMTMVMREPNPAFEEQLRASGAQVIPEQVMGRTGVIVLIDGTDGAQLGGVARALADKPAGVMVLEEPGTQADRLRLTEAAREQGLTGPTPEPVVRTPLPEAPTVIDRPVSRPEAEVAAAPVVAPVVAQPEAAALQLETAAPMQATRPPAAERELASVERTVLVQLPADGGKTAEQVEQALKPGNFELQRLGPPEAPTALSATYRLTDSADERAAQQKGLALVDNAFMQGKGVRLEEPEGQAKEREAALQAPGRPRADQLVGKDMNLRAVITVQEPVGAENPTERVTAVWKNLSELKAGNTNIQQKEQAEGAGSAYMFSVQYSPGNKNLHQINSVLEAVGKSDGMQVLETADNRLERLSRGMAREATAAEKRTPAQQEQVAAANTEFRTSIASRYAAPEPERFERLAITAPEIGSEKGLKAFRTELKETGVEVGFQHRENMVAGPTVVLTFATDHPQRPALDQKLESWAEKGAQVYDVRNRAPYETEQQQPARPVEGPAVEAAPAVTQLETGRASIVERELAAQLAADANLRSLGDTANLSRPAQTPAGAVWAGTGPDLRGVDLYEKDASGMDLRGANLAGQDLQRTDLRHADLRDTNLTGADMRGLDLTGTRFEGAVMQDVKLDGASRLMKDEVGQRVLEENLTPAQLVREQQPATPEQAPQSYQGPEQQPQGPAIAAEPVTATLQPTEQAVAEPIVQAPVVPGAAEPAVREVVEGPAAQLAPELGTIRVNEQGQVQMELTTPAPVLSLPVESELTPEQKGTPLPGPQTQQPEQVQPAGPEQDAPQAAAPALDSMSRYEAAELNGQAARLAEIVVVQPLAATEASQAQLQQVETLLQQTGARFEAGPAVTDEAAGTVSQPFRLAYTNDDRNLEQVNKGLGEIATLSEQPGSGITLTDASAANRQASLESRVTDSPEALQKLASELHDGSQQTGRVLIDRPAIADVYMLEAAGAQVERVHLPTGPAAMVSYALDRPEIAAVVSVELDRIDRDAGARPAPGKTAEEVSGPLLGEDVEQRRVRQQLATDAGLEVAARPRYEEGEIMAEQKRTRADFNAEMQNPVGGISGTLADGEQWRGSFREAIALESDDRKAMLNGWKEQTSQLTILVEQAPGGVQEGSHAEKVAQALQSTGATTRMEQNGISPDTGLERTLVHVSMEHNQPDMARFQATLRALNEQDSVQVPSEGYWQREAMLGKGGSREAEPADIERTQRPWLEAAVAVSEPTLAERQGLAAAGARVEEQTVEGKPVLMAYYNLDEPEKVGALSLALTAATAENRIVGEDQASRQARESRGEQLQADQQSLAVPLSPTPELEKGQRQYASPADELAAAEEPAKSLSFIGRLREAVDERISNFREGWDAASPQNLALIAAEQKGLQDRLLKDAYDRGWEKGEAMLEGRSGTPGVKAEVLTEQVLRDRRDDERTQPVVLNGAAEGKVLDTQQQVKEGIAEKPATPAGAPTEQLTREGQPAPAIVAEVAPVPVAPVVGVEKADAGVATPKLLLEVEKVQGVVRVEDKGEIGAEERAELMRGFLAKNGLDVRNVLPPPPNETSPYSVPFSYNPADPRIDQFNKVLAVVQNSGVDTIQEAPHAAKEPDLKKEEAAAVAMPYWKEREGQHNIAHIVVDDTTGQGRGPAERIKDELKSSGATVGEIKSDGHGKVEMDVAYHTQAPSIEKINNTLDGAGMMNGVQVQETDQNKVARNAGAAAVNERAQNKNRDSGIERD